MDIKLLEDFVCLVKFENFTKAALERNITQSALSRRLKMLEAWLGVNLIYRDSKNFSLTAEGRIFIAEAEIILHRLYSARESISSLVQQKEQVEIAIAAQNSIAQTLFLGWMKRIEVKHTNLYTRLFSEKLADCVDLFNQGKADYLFCYAHEALNLPLDENKFSSTTVGKECLVAVSIPDASGQPQFSVPGSSDRPLPYAAYTFDSLFGKAVDKLIQQKAHTCFLQRRFESVYSHTLKSMVKEGMGLAWLPESAIQKDLQNGNLCRAGSNKWDISFDVKLFYRHAAVSTIEQSIVEISQQMAAESDGK